MPSEDRLSVAEHELRDHLIVMLGGRAAEKLIYQETTAGAENDLERATGMARRMVTHWGMSERLGPVSYKISEEDPFLGREIHRQRMFSEHTMELIDDEVARILHDAAEQCRTIADEPSRRTGKTDQGPAGIGRTHRTGNQATDRPVSPRVICEQQQETPNPG